MSTPEATDKTNAQNDHFCVGQQKNLTDKVPVEDLFRQLAAAVAANQRDSVFDLAAKLVATPTRGLLTPEEVAHELRVSPRTLWRLQGSDPRFPKPVRVGSQRRWHAAEIDGFTRRDKPKQR